jgi:hypothetical protein
LCLQQDAVSADRSSARHPLHRLRAERAGRRGALAAGIDDLSSGVATSDSFNELNLRMTTEQGMRALDEIAAAAKSKVPIVQ